MKRFLILFLSIFLSMAYVQGQENVQAEPAKKVLLLNSYHRTLPWNLNFEEGVKRYLFNNKFDLDIEYLDSRRKPFDSLEERFFLKRLTHKYANSRFDLILVTDDPALFFLQNNYDSLIFLQNTPIIASGISNVNLVQQMQDKEIFIFREVLKYAEMVRKIMHLFPNTEQFFIITQLDIVGDFFRKDFLREINNDKKISPKINFMFNNSGDIEEIAKKISKLSENAIVLIYNYGGTEGKLYYRIDEVLKVIRRNSELPVFCILKDWIVESVTGGYVVDPEEQGLMLGERAAMYFNEGKPFVCGIDSTSIQQKWIFNKLYLKRFNIPKQELPYGAEVINDNEKTVWALIAISLVLFTLLVIIYIINRVLKHRIRSRTLHLRDKINKSEFFLSEMPIGYIALNENYHILRWNRATENIFKYSSEEVKGQNLIDLLSLTWEESKLIKGDVYTTRHFTNQSKTKEGKDVVCEWYITQYKSTAGKPLLFVLVIDVTEEKKLRENLEVLLEKAKEMMVQNDRYMTSNMHDIKNLLLPIVTYSEMMMGDNLPPEKLQKMAKQLHESAQTLLDISVNLLKINKVRGNLMNIEPELFNIYFKTQDIMIVLDMPLSIKKIRLWNKINPHQMVYADSEMINSVLLNLINNAIKFTPEKGEITITSVLTNDGFVQINVTDSGLGFEEAEIDQIFTQQKFSTRVGTSGEKGTGVGLVLSKDLIEKNGGKLSFKNNDNPQGSTFSFTLKVNNSQA